MSSMKKMEKIPQFKNEKEEVEFWSTHSATDFLEDTEEVKEGFEISKELREKISGRRDVKKMLSLRLDKELIDMTKVIARRKAIGYQTLMRMWIAEGIRRDKAS